MFDDDGHFAATDVAGLEFSGRPRFEQKCGELWEAPLGTYITSLYDMAIQHIDTIFACAA
jgi:hypothetical protein